MASSIASRSVIIQTQPATRTLAESRSVLEALQKFGRVATFRNLRYDTTNRTHSPTTNKILAIFESPTGAEKAINASPLSVPLPESSTKFHPLYNKPRADPLHPWATSDEAQRLNMPIEINCSVARARHNHTIAQGRNPYYSYYITDDETYQFYDLRHSTGIPVRALADAVMSRREGTGLPKESMRGIEHRNRLLGAMSLFDVYMQGLGKAEKEGKGKGKKTGESKSKSESEERMEETPLKDMESESNTNAEAGEVKGEMQKE